MPETTPQQYPRSLPAPGTAVSVLDQDMLGNLVKHSRLSPRRRMVQLLHTCPEENPQRMLNSLQPDSYIAPHRHLHPPKTETILLLQGRLCVIIYSDAGKTEAVHTLDPSGECFGIDIAPGLYHTFVALAPDTVFLEIKPGPYVAADDKDYAAWAPPEESQDAAGYLAQLRKQLPAAT